MKDRERVFISCIVLKKKLGKVKIHVLYAKSCVKNFHFLGCQIWAVVCRDDNCSIRALMSNCLKNIEGQQFKISYFVLRLLTKTNKLGFFHKSSCGTENFIFHVWSFLKV